MKAQVQPAFGHLRRLAKGAIERPFPPSTPTVCGKKFPVSVRGEFAVKSAPNGARSWSGESSTDLFAHFPCKFPAG